MRRPALARAVIALAVLLPTLVLAAEPGATAKATPKDSKFLVDYLTQNQKDFLKSIDGLSEAQWKFKPAPDRWSIAEVAEHIALAKGTPESELRSHVSGPSPMGDLDAYQWMLFMAAHSKRHLAQIEEVKADPNFPKK